MDSPPGYSILFPDDGEHPAAQSHDAGQSNFGWAMSVATGNDDFARLARAIERCQKDAKAQNVEAEKILDLINLRSAIFQPPKAKTKAPMSQDTATVPKIKTKGVFSFMDLPAELRVKICEYILISVSDIAIPHKRAPKPKQETLTYPSVAILRACKLLNEEATPILYGKNNFAITLPDPSSRFDESFPLFSSLRWTSIELIPRLSFTSFTNPGDKISPASFVCTGADILTQFKPGDFRLSPVGMDRYHVRHAWNWISCEVMKAELAAFQKEWKELMEPAGFELPPMDWDPQSLFGLQEFGYL